jgi:O-methyltransferase involved in polyketide biosynthesis
LSGAGLDFGLPIFFSCLGVMPFLTHGAVVEFLKSIGAMSAGTEIVFDYINATATLTAEERRAFESRAERVAMIGEPWQSSFDPATLANAARGLGFREIENLGSDAINSRYYADRDDGLEVGPLAQFMRATV